MRRKKRKPSIVDTNVAIVANHLHGEPLSCAAACASVLHEITRTGVLVIDEGGLIFDEYKNHLSFAGRPGAGDYFFKWLSDNRYKPDRVAQVALVEDPAHPGEFVAFPADPDLAMFDRSDRKFVAASITHPERPPIINATDDDWWNHRDALARQGLIVQFVCGEEQFKGD